MDFFRLPDETGGKGVGIENLAVVKDAGCGSRGRFQSIEDAVELFVAVCDVLDLAKFYLFDFLEEPGVLEQESAHFDKGLDDADAHCDSSRAVQNSGKHGDSLFRKDMGKVFAVLATGRDF